jgi:hypothetical protein
MMSLRRYEHYALWIGIIIIGGYALLVNHAQDIEFTKHMANEKALIKRIDDLEFRIHDIEDRHHTMDTLRYQGKVIRGIPVKKR